MSDASIFIEQVAVCGHIVNKITSETAILARQHGARNDVVRSLGEAGDLIKKTLTAIRDVSSLFSGVEVLTQEETVNWSQMSLVVSSIDHFLDDHHYLLREINKPTGILFDSRQQLRLKRSKKALTRHHGRLVEFQSNLNLIGAVLLWGWQRRSGREPGSMWDDEPEHLERVNGNLTQGQSQYHQFLQTVSRIQTGEIDTPEVVRMLVALFQNEQELPKGLEPFLPGGYGIEAKEGNSEHIQILAKEGGEMNERLNIDVKSSDEPNVNKQRTQLAGSPTEFNSALNFVNKVKSHYENTPDTYVSFLEILQTYQKEALAISDVHQQVSELFESAPELIQEFSNFLPNSADTADQPARSDFQYSPLDLSKFETRFLSIANKEPIGEDEPVSAQLLHRSLINPPEYVALSYCWGDLQPCRHIVLDSQDHFVTSNLESALQRLRRNECSTVWADALCINQQDSFERSHQVARMGSIYSLASKVIAWLGDSMDESDSAMDVLDALGRSPGDDKLLDAALRHKDAIQRLLSRPYWERLWIIQEISKASKLEVWCGDRSTVWEHFIQGINTLALGTPATQTLQQFCEQELASRRGNARMLLSMAMIRTTYAKSTDPRDIVYALLGLSRDGAEVVPVPNYVQDSIDVFKAVSKSMIVTQGQTSLIAMAGRRQNLVDGPSWLPLWTSQHNILYPFWLKNSIIEAVSRPTQLHVSGSRLVLSAIKVHTIIATETVFSSKFPLVRAGDGDGNGSDFTRDPQSANSDLGHDDIDNEGPDDHIRSWTSEEVLKWMYETSTESSTVEAFRQHNINGAALLALKFSDLVEVGVTPQNKRVELWNAIGLLRGKAPVRDTDATDSLTTSRRPTHRLLSFIQLLRECVDPPIRDHFTLYEDALDLLLFWSLPNFTPHIVRLRGLYTSRKYLLGDDKTPLEELIEYVQRMLRVLTPSKSQIKVRSLEALESALTLLETHKMKFVCDSDSHYYAVPSECQHGDCVFKLDNCTLPVLLRPNDEGHYRVIGEVLIAFEPSGTSRNWFERMDRNWEEISLI